MTRFLGWYLAAILAAYSISASWALGSAGERLTEVQQQATQLSDDLDLARTRLNVLEGHQHCVTSPQSCLQGDW
jgi:hypothetical protein